MPVAGNIVLNVHIKKVYIKKVYIKTDVNAAGVKSGTSRSIRCSSATPSATGSEPAARTTHGRIVREAGVGRCELEAFENERVASKFEHTRHTERTGGSERAQAVRFGPEHRAIAALHEHAFHRAILRCLLW